MGTTLEQVAAHEAGHAILGLAAGWQLRNITTQPGKHPESFLPGMPDATLATNFVLPLPQIEARLTYLIAAGGMAGEIVLHGKYHLPGAGDDLAKLKAVNLSDHEIEGLIQIATRALNANLSLWKKTKRRMLSGLERKQAVLVEGIPINTLFKHTGKRFTDFAGLDKILPLES